MEKNMMTLEGRTKLENDIKLKRGEAKELVEAIVDAKDKGDITENAEFIAAKEAYEMVQQKLANLESTLSHSVVISEEDVDTSCVSLLTNVKVQNLKDKKEMQFKIVPENEIDLKKSYISYKSPIGSALIGKKKGEKVSIDIPSGTLDLKILKISA
jgi:transcription elongation factor GreA